MLIKQQLLVTNFAADLGRSLVGYHESAKKLPVHLAKSDGDHLILAITFQDLT